jgi:cytochrome P450
VIQRHPDFWENPEGFEPERFSPERAAGRHKFAYFPFGAGPRKCIGDYFGELEMQLVVAMIAQHFRLDLVPGVPVIPQPAISLRVQDGLPMTLHALSPEPSKGERP